jgi:hypothetical protein
MADSSKTGYSWRLSTDWIGVGEAARVLAYNMDLLHPGFYLWVGTFSLRLGGYQPDDAPYPYPGTLHSRLGLALVLPGYRCWTTYRGTFDENPSPALNDNDAESAPN